MQLIIQRTILVTLAVAVATPVLAQEEEVSTAEIKQALRSPDSRVRHETWKRLNPEKSSHYKVLLQILAKLSWYDREAAIVALAKAATDKTLDKMVKDLKKNKDRFVRQGLAEALAKMNDPKYYAHLYEALQDRDPFVRRVVVHALRVHKKPEAVDALIDLFQNEKDPVVRTFIERSLNEITQAYQGSNPIAWATWWTLAKADKDYQLGKTDAEAIREAEEFGRKLKARKTISAAGRVTIESLEKGGETGEGVPILVIPHYGKSENIMLPFLSELERRHKLFYIKLPPLKSFDGLESVGKTKLPLYPIERLVAAFEDLRKETGNDHFAIMACGVNAWIAMRYARLYPKSLAAMVLVAPYSSTAQLGKATKRLVDEGEKRGDIEMWHVGLTRSINIETGESAHDQYHREKKIAKPEGEDASLDRRDWSLFFRNEQDSVLSMLYPVMRYQMGGVIFDNQLDLLKEDPPAVPVPTLVIAGDTLLTDIEDCKRVAGFYKGTFVPLKGSAWMPFAEESDKFNKVVGIFLKKYARQDPNKVKAAKKE